MSEKNDSTTLIKIIEAQKDDYPLEIKIYEDGSVKLSIEENRECIWIDEEIIKKILDSYNFLKVKKKQIITNKKQIK